MTETTIAKGCDLGWGNYVPWYTRTPFHCVRGSIMKSEVPAEDVG